MRRLYRSLVVCLAFGQLAACERPTPPDERADTSAPVATSPDQRWIDLANDVAMLAAGRPSTPDELAKLANAHYAKDAFTSYVSDLLATPEASKVAIHLLHLDVRSRGDRWTMAADLPVLKREYVEGQMVYYLRDTCSLADAVRVKPWWKMSSTVLVCDSSYHPDVFAAPGERACPARGASKSAGPACMCGPNLMRCSPDKQTDDKLEAAIIGEHEDTLSYIASHALPIQTVFSSKDSFRSGLATFMYQRWRIESHEIKSLADVPPWTSWPAQGKWAPRYESRKGEHAGISTNLTFAHTSGATRAKLVDFVDAMWCDVVQSSVVSTQSLLDITFHSAVVPNLRTEINPADLAGRPVCTNCHARLDYGSQFYAGYYMSSTHYDVRRQLDTPGPMYLRDLSDFRGNAPRNPEGFVKLALAQPEFPACMAHRFSTYVFGKNGDVDNSDLVTSLESLVAKQASYRELYKKTLDYYVDKRFAEAPPAAAHDGAFLTMMDEQCSSCHGTDDPRPPGLVAKYGASWCTVEGTKCAGDAMKMMQVVANGRMPQFTDLTSAQRSGMIKELARYAWTDAAQRNASIGFFLDQAMGGKPIHSGRSIVESIHELAPDTRMPPLAPPSELGTFGPTLGLELGAAAAAACSTQTDKVGCIHRALSPDRILK